MEFVLTPEQMAAADRAAIAAGTPETVLMERAGWELARGVRDILGGTYGRRVVVVAGKGNNGGDGQIAAGVLDRWGTRVDRFALDPGFDPDALARALARADAAIDAMYGTGFRGALDGLAATAAEHLGMSGVPTVSCDIPSGVDGLTGATAGPAVDAVLTVCFGALKRGLLFWPGSGHAGIIRVAPIGIDATAAAPGRPAYLLDEEDCALLLPGRDDDTHKWAAGAVYVVAGKAGMLGAAALAARASLRAGAGLVVLGVPGGPEGEGVGDAGPEVITRPLPATPEGALDEGAAKEVLGEIERFGALVVGPGVGVDARTATAVTELVKGAPVPLVIDADGLNVLSGQLDVVAARTGETVLTPHAGEFERLAGAPVGADRIEAAAGLAERADAVVLLKGSTTVIAEPAGGVVLNRTGGPWLATAGTGDVLAGIIGSLLAQGLPAFEAAALGAYLHGRAADGLPLDGLVAGDLIDALPATLHEVRMVAS